MKKICIVMGTALFLMCSLSGCRAQFDKMALDRKSDFGKLEREITVRNLRDNTVIWKFKGSAYIEDSSTVGNVTIVYYDEHGKPQKLDVIGDSYGVESITTNN
jgi:hypothetical protein